MKLDSLNPESEFLPTVFTVRSRVDMAKNFTQKTTLVAMNYIDSITTVSVNNICKIKKEI